MTALDARCLWHILQYNCFAQYVSIIPGIILRVFVFVVVSCQTLWRYSGG